MAADVESTVTAKLTEKLTENFEKEKAEAAQRADAEQKEKFMVLSQFLRLVADRRSEGADPTIDQNAALESLLATFFGGDQEAVSAMQKLVDGVDEAVVSTSGDVLEATFGTLKAAAEHHLEVLAYNTTAEIEGDAAAAATSDPTIANIAATEIAAGDKELSSSDPTPVVAAETNGVHPPAEPASDEEDYKNSSTAPQDEPARPPDAPETETAVEEPSFAPPKHAPSWADDHPEPATQVRKSFLSFLFYLTHKYRHPLRPIRTMASQQFIETSPAAKVTGVAVDEASGVERAVATAAVVDAAVVVVESPTVGLDEMTLREAHSWVLRPPTMLMLGLRPQKMLTLGPLPARLLILGLPPRPMPRRGELEDDKELNRPSIWGNAFTISRVLMPNQPRVIHLITASQQAAFGAQKSIAMTLIDDSCIVRK